MANRVLLIDDDILLCRSLTFILERAGFRVTAAASAEEGLAAARRDAPDVVLLDIGLPGMDGLTALEHFRGLAGIPVLLLTARRGSSDEVLGLELGADDYIVKPADPAVLLARINTALRKHARAESTAASRKHLAVGDLSIDPDKRRVTIAGRTVDLAPRVFDLLYALAARPDHVLSADALLAEVWGAGFQGEPQALYVHIRWLREALETDPNVPRRVVTVRGAGYRLVPQPAGRE